MALYTSLLLILPNGRRSGLVREGAVKLSENASPDATVFANKFAPTPRAGGRF
ncbi:hypothetical protein GIW06_12250 [Pseudomonas syringae]|nr:hypothetical protein [Pseudomonas syringae]MCF5201179.1 hypothetical protein [Pseudomonas syringae]MCF5273185.1 hypothetical protein [Pseudomonas syringae]MCF5278321.1 hypothetical protein [Pseudomonas syringae]MCF5280735.1 hypothetical protein [Pseudomonas syringae]